MVNFYKKIICLWILKYVGVEYNVYLYIYIIKATHLCSYGTSIWTLKIYSCNTKKKTNQPNASNYKSDRFVTFERPWNI